MQLKLGVKRWMWSSGQLPKNILHTVQEQGLFFGPFSPCTGWTANHFSLINLTPAPKSNQCFMGSVKLEGLPCYSTFICQLSCQLLYLLKCMQFSNEIPLYRLTSLGLKLIMIISLMISTTIKQDEWEPFWELVVLLRTYFVLLLLPCTIKYVTKRV